MRKSPEYLLEISQVWPMEHILFDLNYWGVEKYIVNQDMYHDMFLDLEKQVLDGFKKINKKIDKETSPITNMDESPEDEKNSKS